MATVCRGDLRPDREGEPDLIGNELTGGAAHSFDPPFPLHSLLLGAGRYGVTQVANLSQLPSTGAVVVVAPLKLVRCTGSPARVLALVPRP